MEREAPAAEPEPAGVALPTDPDALRALADSKARRRARDRAEYQRQRRALLQPAR
jgi:hypothetical protein